MDEASRDEDYREFLDSYGGLISQLVTADWTRREARFRLLTLYPHIEPAFLDRALVDKCWERSTKRVEEPLSGVVIAASLWLAVNELFDLGQDHRYAVTFLDAGIVQDMAAFMDMHDVADESAAEILARIAATMNFLSKYPRTTLTGSDYRAFHAKPPSYLHELAGKEQGRWPASDSVLRDQLGEGSWSRTLLSVGMSTEYRYDRDGTDRIPDYTEPRFRSAIADFFTYCVRHDRKPHALLYGQWAASDARGRVPRPTLATIRHHFGSWNRALAHGRELVNKSEPGQGDPRYEENWVGPWTQPADIATEAGLRESWTAQHWAERGIGVVEHVIEEASGDEGAWETLAAEVTQALRDLPWNHFLTVEYETGDNLNDSPFGQAFTGPGGVDVTLVSEHFLPAVVWPIDDEYLLETGWLRPDAVARDQPHWQRKRLTVPDAARALIEGLRYGRDCPDPYQFRWGSGTVYRDDHGPGSDGNTGHITPHNVRHVTDRR